MTELTATEANNARRRGLTLIAAAVALAGLGWGGWHWLAGRHQQATDNAYVVGNVVQITPQVAGTVVAIQADETDLVRAGQPLVRLDAADARIALAQAEAQLSQTLRETRSLFAGNATLAAQIQVREADLARARNEQARAQDDVNRRAGLLQSGAVGQEEFQHAQAQLTSARSAVAAAESALRAAHEQLATSQSLTEGTTVEQHPAVQRAASKVREAFLAWRRTELQAPLEGYVAKRAVQIGQRVQAGAPLMTVVALNQLWVDANFKEGQLQSLRIGQPAELVADVYGKKVVFHGQVAGLGAGTGAAFSLLPAQNATGNWIKVVQRVPVRISLDPAELQAHALRVGLSMEVTVDTRDDSGLALAAQPRDAAVASTSIFEAQERAADERVASLMAAASPAGARKTVAAPAAVPASAAR